MIVLIREPLVELAQGAVSAGIFFVYVLFAISLSFFPLWQKQLFAFQMFLKEDYSYMCRNNYD